MRRRAAAGQRKSAHFSLAGVRLSLFFPLAGPRHGFLRILVSGLLRALAVPLWDRLALIAGHCPRSRFSPHI